MSVKIPAPCCNPTQTQPPSSPISMSIAEKTAHVALCLLAAKANVFLFLASLLAGAFVGSLQKSDNSGCCSNNGRPSCAEGFLQQLTKVALPAYLSLLINFAVTGMHIVCHSRIYVPIIGVYTGIKLAN